MIKIGITGLIGSGKSVVAKIFQTFDIPVYFADVEAKKLMLTDNEISTNLIAAFGTEVYCNGILNKEFLSQQIFDNETSRLLINSIVHPAVIKDFEQWTKEQSQEIVAVESALLFESGFDKKTDYSIIVKSPLTLNISRICSRDNISQAEAIKRLKIQRKNLIANTKSNFTINNNERSSLIIQTENILAKITANGKTW